MNEAEKQTVENAGAAVVDLLTQHWQGIKAAEDENGIATITATFKISLTGQVPRGAVGISFASRTKDSADFSGEQLKLKGVTT